MAGKARRAASRQSQLKRKKQTKGPSGIPTGRRVAAPVAPQPAAVPAGVDEPNEYDATPEEIEAAEAAVAGRTPPPSPAAARTPRGEFAGQGRLRGERPAAYLYVGAEFRRITLLTSAMIAAMVVLGILL